MPRRGENIYKRKDGRWEGRYIKQRDISGKAIYGYLYAKSYLEVKNKMKSISVVTVGKKAVADSVEYTAITNEWLSNIKLKVKESTFSRYETIVEKHLNPTFGQINITDIRTQDVENYIGDLLENSLSPKTINDILTVFKSIIKFAEEKHIICSCNTKLISIKNLKKENKVLSECDYQKLEKYLLANMDCRNFGILLCMYTGIRIGELCALRWGDINFDEKVMRINKTMLRIKDNASDKNVGAKTKVVVTSPKTEDSIRSIPIPEFLFNLCKQLKGGDTSYVLTGKVNKYIEPRALQYHFKKILEQCNIDDINFHALRHTFATRCIECGFDVKTLSEILGHSSIKITLDRYVHSSMDLKRRNMDKLSSFSA